MDQGDSNTLDAIGPAQARVDRLTSELREATRQRNELILEASAAGHSRRRVAEMARMTPGRVQQILNGLEEGRR